MTDFLAQFTKVLDRMLPFVEAAPSWLRTWIYVLIILNFITAAGLTVSYLISRQVRSHEGSLASFTLDRPVDDQEIPLREGDPKWIVEGKFPKTMADSDLDKTAKVKVRVFRLPNREEVPQEGEPRVSTVTGTWEFESATFSGDGPHEIVARAFLGSKNVWVKRRVRCTGKAASLQSSIDRDRKQFGMAPPVVPAPDAARKSLPQRKAWLYAANEDLFELLEKHDHSQASALVLRAFDVIDPVLPMFPDDDELQNQRAYFLKNYALVMRETGRPADAKLALDEAERMFELIRQQNPGDPSAWNGLGSVSLMRDDPWSAEVYIRRALEIEPNYPEALHDLALVKQQIAQLGSR